MNSLKVEMKVVHKKYKIDLHSHSKNSKPNGDIINFHETDVIHSWKKNNVKIASFTDKNIFSHAFYNEWRKKASKYHVLLFPGIEINIQTKNRKESDMILIFSNTLSSSELIKIENILNERTSKFFKSFEEIIDSFNIFNPLYIPHIGKERFCTYELLKKNLDKIFVIESTNLKNSNHQKFMKKTNNKYLKKIVHFSDTHLWEHYPQYGLNNVFYQEINSFENLVFYFKTKDIIYEKSKKI